MPIPEKGSHRLDQWPGLFDKAREAGSRYRLINLLKVEVKFRHPLPAHPPPQHRLLTRKRLFAALPARPAPWILTGVIPGAQRPLSDRASRTVQFRLAAVE